MDKLYMDQERIKNQDVGIGRQVPVKAFQINEETQVIKAIGQDNLIYEYLFEEFTEICLFGSKNIEFPKVNLQNKTQYQKEIFDQGRSLKLIDKTTNQVKYTINQLSLITCVVFSNCGKQFIVGLNDGSIYIYDVGQQIIEKYRKPVCIKIFARSPALLADCCNIQDSIFLTQENENLQTLFVQKGAKKDD